MAPLAIIKERNKEERTICVRLALTAFLEVEEVPIIPAGAQSYTIHGVINNFANWQILTPEANLEKNVMRCQDM